MTLLHINIKPYYNYLFNDQMKHHSSTLFFGLILTLLVSSAMASNTHSYSYTLQQLYDDGSEMNTRIISEFISSQICQSSCSKWSRKELMSQFQIFRAGWVEKMINFVIAELNVDPQSAKRVRQNPNNYMVNYETFKLLSFK